MCEILIVLISYYNVKDWLLVNSQI